MSYNSYRIHGVQYKVSGEENMNEVTAIVVGRNRLDTLRVVLDRLESIKEIAEVIYIDTGSSVNIIDKINSEFPRIKTLICDSHNPQDARNMGGVLSRSTITLFIDDDCLIDKDAVKIGLNALLKNPLIGALGFGACAEVEGVFVSVPACTKMSPFWTSMEISRIGRTGMARVFTIRNAYLVRTSVFRSIKGWDSLYFIQGDETDFLYKIYKKGYYVAYIDSPKIIDLTFNSPLKSSLIAEINMTRPQLVVRNALLMAFKHLSLPFLMLVLFPMLFATFAYLAKKRLLKDGVIGFIAFIGILDFAIARRNSEGKKSLLKDISLYRLLIHVDEL